MEGWGGVGGNSSCRLGVVGAQALLLKRDHGFLLTRYSGCESSIVNQRVDRQAFWRHTHVQVVFLE